VGDDLRDTRHAVGGRRNTGHARLDQYARHALATAAEQEDVAGGQKVADVGPRPEEPDRPVQAPQSDGGLQFGP
jgi:hypothetical protein